MKTPLVIVIAIVVGILGFLVFFSQQRDVTTQAHQQEVSAEAPAQAAAAPAHASGEK
jgi:hypothetical protein